MTLGLLLFLGVVGCRGDVANPESGKSGQGATPRVVVTFWAAEQLCDRLLDDSVKVDFPAVSESNPRIWQPSSDDVASMQAASLVVTGGPALPYAEWIPKISLAESRIYQFGKAMKLSEFVHVNDYRIVHRHGPEGEHSHPLLIPHFWLDPTLTAKATDHLASRLGTVFDSQAEAIEAERKKLSESLRQLGAKWENLGESIETKENWVFTNPHFSFLARRIGVANNYLVWLEDKPEKKDERCQELLAKLKPFDKAVIVTTKGFSEKLVEECQRDGDIVIQLDLIEFPDGDQDLLQRLEAMYHKVRDALDLE